ncbi:MAG: metallophosphoesterase, partial [Acutalibacteraceae bacterium]
VFSGSGTKADPYKITSEDDFNNFTNDLKSGETYSGKYFVQTKDIDMSSVSSYQGLNESYTFAGTYNGNGKTINVSISKSSGNYAVFPYVTGTVMNTGTTGSIKTSTSATNYACGIARSVRETGVIINCFSRVSLSGFEVSGIAQSNRGKIINCYYAGSMSATYRYHVMADPQSGYSYKFESNFGPSSIDDTNGSGTYTKLSDTDMKSTGLAISLNSGRSSASTASISESDLLYWESNGSYPTLTEEEPIYEENDNVSINYVFSGKEMAKAGYAEGTISVVPNDSSSSGVYYLYWADEKEALAGYSEIASVSVSGSAGTVKMPNKCAIPAGATSVIAIKSSAEPTDKTVLSASAVYSLPKGKLFPHSEEEKLYSFASYSDIHIAEDSYGSKSYPYDEQHLAAAFDTADKRNVDFIVTSGDQVNNQNGNGYDTSEWKTYQKILADSNYSNPIWEAIGNHELWSASAGNIPAHYKSFIKATGLCKIANDSDPNEAYYTFDEEKTGDHFIVMALETNFYPDRNNEFSDEQLAWVESLLEKYKNDGKNTFIIEHAGFWKWGAGDDPEDPYYDIPLMTEYNGVSMEATKKLQSLLYKYTDAVFISGHTHIQFADQFNYVDSVDGVSTAKMIHNSSVGGIRKVNATSSPHMGKLDRTNLLDETEGYIVDTYDDCIIFNGTNLYYNEIMPMCMYMVSGDTSVKSTGETKDPYEDMIKGTETYMTGDANLDKVLSVKDATLIQKASAKIVTFSDVQNVISDVNGDDFINVKDATSIQKVVAKIYSEFPIGNTIEVSVGGISVTLEDLAGIKTTASSTLATNYQYSSYDEYMSLKKVYKECASKDSYTEKEMKLYYVKLKDLNDKLLAVING